MDPKTTIDEKGGTITIVLPLDKDAPLSKSGKSRIIGGTNGFAKADATFKGAPVSISVNVTIPKP